MEPTVTMPSQTLRRPAFDLAPTTRIAMLAGGAVLCAASLAALVRLGLGLAPQTESARELAIVIHLATVIPAIPLGLLVFLGPKGTRTHRRLGLVWMGLMGITALSTLFIRHINDGSFSFVHLFVPLTLVGIVQAIVAARQGRIGDHKRHLVNLYFGALLVAGLFSFLPGRLMWAWLVR